MYKTVIIVLSLVAASSAYSKPCNASLANYGPMPVAIRINHCPGTPDVCKIIRERNIIADIDFIAGK
jgi:hypothetical protein